MMLLNKAFAIMDEFDDESNKVVNEDMTRARVIIWTNGLDAAIPRLNESIHPFHGNVREALRQVHYMMDMAA